MTHVFDCDGVLIASNAVKSRAFYLTALHYGTDVAVQAIELHRTAGSISRRDRWVRIFDEIIGHTPTEAELDRVNLMCSQLITRGVRSARLVPGVRAFIEQLDGPKVVVSGVQNPELSEVLAQHDLLGLFDSVHGGPKAEVFGRLISEGIIDGPSTYYGDTRDDWVTSTGVGMDFVLVTHDSEWNWTSDYSGPHLSDFRMSTIGER